MYACWEENTPNLSEINSKAHMILELRKKLSCYHKHISIILICCNDYIMREAVIAG